MFKNELQLSPEFQQAKKNLLSVIQQKTAAFNSIRPAANESAREEYLKTIQTFQKNRGRDLYYPYLSSGVGSGPFVQLVDGSVKYDMITGIGINFFGHAHPELISEMIDATGSDVMQGNLQPGIEAAELIAAILSRVGTESKLKHGWMMCSGTMTNEVALKIIRQKNFPATKILAFKDCFAGRSTAMQEITDNPGYRQGQPTYGEVHYLPFYDPKLGLEKSTAATLSAMNEHLARYPGKFAALMIELIQGEGGFTSAPREWYVSVFEEAKKAKLAVWADEIQTFGRTGELFAFQKFKLSSYIDVVTVGKMLQACLLLFTEEFNPKPGLVAGTFSGSAVALRTARRTLELLDEGNFLGGDGRIEKLSKYFTSQLERLMNSTCKGKISDIRAIGGMIGFMPFSGSADEVKKVLMKLFDLGVVAFYCGHGPLLIRMLPPLGVMTEKQIDEVCHLIDVALNDLSAAGTP